MACPVNSGMFKHFGDLSICVSMQTEPIVFLLLADMDH